MCVCVSSEEEEEEGMDIAGVNLKVRRKNWTVVPVVIMLSLIL